MEEVGHVVFELGRVLLKMELSKRGSAAAIRELDAPQQEQILVQSIGKYINQRNLWDRPDGLVIVTNYRIVFLAKQQAITATTDFLSLPLPLVERLHTTKVWFFIPAIRFEIERHPVVFTFFSGAEKICATIVQAQAALAGALRSDAGTAGPIRVESHVE